MNAKNSKIMEVQVSNKIGLNKINNKPNSSTNNLPSINRNKIIFIYTNIKNNKNLKNNKDKNMSNINQSTKLQIKNNKIVRNKRKETISTNSIK